MPASREPAEAGTRGTYCLSVSAAVRTERFAASGKKFRGENFPLTPFAHTVRQTSVYLPKLSFSATARLNTGCAGA
jgi:hypothetical protein